MFPAAAGEPPTLPSPFDVLDRTPATSRSGERHAGGSHAVGSRHQREPRRSPSAVSPRTTSERHRRRGVALFLPRELGTRCRHLAACHSAESRGSVSASTGHAAPAASQVSAPLRRPLPPSCAIGWTCQTCGRAVIDARVRHQRRRQTGEHSGSASAACRLWMMVPRSPDASSPGPRGPDELLATGGSRRRAVPTGGDMWPSCQRIS
jgi:hypothetical protein